MLDAPLRFNAFRLPTDNDKNRTESWDRMGLRNLTVNAGTWNVEERTGYVDLSIENTYKLKIHIKGTRGMSFRLV